MESFCFLRWLYVSTTHLAWKVIKFPQFKRHFYITRRDLAWQLFVHFINIPCVDSVWDKFFCCLIYNYIQGLKLIGKIVRNDNQFTVILCSYSFRFIIVLAFKCIHNNQRTLLFQVLAPSFWLKNEERRSHWKDLCIFLCLTSD